MVLRPHRYALGESRARAAALSPAARGGGGNGAVDVLPWDYWHTPGNSGFSPLFVAGPQPSSLPDGTTVGPTSGVIAVYPFFVGLRGRTVTSLGTEVLGTSAAALQMGIYDVQTPGAYDIYPQTLLGSVAVDVSALGMRRGVLGTPLELPNGLYWVAVFRGVGGGSTHRAYNGSGGYRPEILLGHNPLQWTGTVVNTLLSVAHVGAVLPPAFPAGAAPGSANPFAFEVL